MDFLAKHRWLHHLYTPLVLGLFFAIIETTGNGAEDRDMMILVLRPVISAIVIWMVMLPVTATMNAALDGKGLPLVLRLVLSSLIGCFPLAIILPWIMVEAGIAWPDQVDGWMPVAGYEAVFFDRYIQFLMVVPVIWVFLNWRWYRVQEDSQAVVRPAQSEAIAPAFAPDEPVVTTPQDQPVITLPAFVSRLSKPVGTEVHALKSEQHYVRVFGNESDDLMLYRLSDAIRDMGDVPGMQVHRSWWVAKSGIKSVDTSGKNWEITLHNDEQVPVSRSYKQAFEQTGWHLPTNQG